MISKITSNCLNVWVLKCKDYIIVKFHKTNNYLCEVYEIQLKIRQNMIQ